jgi:hypothetical protein
MDKAVLRELLERVEGALRATEDELSLRLATGDVAEGYYTHGFMRGRSFAFRVVADALLRALSEEDGNV